MLLFGVLGVAAWEFLAEPAADEERNTSAADQTSEHGKTTTGDAWRRPPATAGRPVPALLMGGALVACLLSVSLQRACVHRAAQPTADHRRYRSSVSCIDLGGGDRASRLDLYRLPKVAGEAGPILSARVLARFSQVATIALIVVLATGTVRSLGQLSAILQLWETGYGRSALKIGMLAPIGFLALRNRKILAALAMVRQPNRATLGMIRRSAVLEFTLALVVVVIASLLVSQVPGRVQ